MKKTDPDPRRKAGGFTLVELLVVIAIIVVLASMTLVGISIATNHKNKTQTLAHATGLLQAIEGFHNDYHRLPDVGTDELRMEGQAGSEFLIILLGKEELNSSTQNKKQMPYLSVQETSTKNKGGLLFSSRAAGATPEGLYDAWGNPFYVKLDTQGDREIEDPLKSNTVVRNKVVIVYSSGRDGKIGTSDDVKTW